jgi:hypothetical protein
MMDVHNLSNSPVKFTISGKTFDVKRLSILDLFATFEAEVKRVYLDDVISLAGRMQTTKERIDFQKAALKEMPRGKELQDQVAEIMNSFEGGIKILHLALSKCNTISYDEVKQMVVSSTNPAEISSCMDYVVGSDISVGGDKKEEKKSDATFGSGTVAVDEKKTNSDLTEVLK